MTDEEIIKGLDLACSSITGSFMWTVNPFPILRDYIHRLQSENVALRERLEKAVELPVNIGDKVYMPWVYGGESGIAECEVYHIALFKDRNDGSLIVTDLKSDNIDFKREYNYGQFMLRDFGVKVFTAREAALARLAELKGEQDG